MGSDGVTRCWWCGEHEDYIAYHDQEWGRPKKSDRALFEKLCLEGFQSGLSWLTILRKREGFRRAFENFDLEVVAGYTDQDVERLLQDAAIVRHRKKIESTINNAQRAIALIEEWGTLADYFWQYVPDPASRPARIDYDTAMTLTKTPESIAMSKDLKKRSWSFVGPTTAYSFMQSVGIVNDHLEGCAYTEEIENLKD